MVVRAVDEKFSKVQIIFLLVVSIGISNHIILVPHLIKSIGRDSWISILFSYIVLMTLSYILFMIINSMKDTTLQAWLEERIGKLGYWIIAMLMILFLLIEGMLVVFDTIETIKIYLLPNTPVMIIIFLFMIVLYIAISGGLRTVIYMSAMLLPVVLLLELAVNAMTLSNKDYGMLLPVMTNGMGNSLQGIAIVVGGSMDLLFILFLQNNINGNMKYRSILLLLTMLIILALSSTIGIIASFGPFFAGNIRFPTFEEWRLAFIGRYISHVDFFAVFQLLTGSLIRTTLVVHILTQLTKVKTTIKQRIYIMISVLLICLPSLLQVSDIQVQLFIDQYFFLYSLCFGIGMTTVLLIIRYLPSRKGTF